MGEGIQAAVKQRIDINCILPRLDRSETEKYIQAHLAYAGGRQDIFTDAAVDDIHKESTGIPRRINRICEKSLMYAFQQNHRLIDDACLIRMTSKAYRLDFPGRDRRINNSN